MTAQSGGFFGPRFRASGQSLASWAALSPLPGKPGAQADEDQPGEPLLQSGKTGVAAQQVAQSAAGISDRKIDQGAANIEDQAKKQNLPDHAAATRVNKLGKKGEKEECDLRIEQVGDHPLTKDGGQGVRFEVLRREIGALGQHL